MKLDLKDYLLDPSAVLMGFVASGFSKAATGTHVEGRDIEWEAFSHSREQGWLSAIIF